MSENGRLTEDVLGPHPEEFYTSVGRVACLSALVEQHLTSVRTTLAFVPQGKFTSHPASRQIEAARKLRDRIQASDRARVTEYLDRALDAMERRNAVIHSVFPAQPNGMIKGHRPIRDRSIQDATACWTSGDGDKLDQLVSDLYKLIQDFPSVLALCQPKPHQLVERLSTS